MEARLVQANLEKARVENLFEAGAATQEEVEEARASSDALAAARDSAAAQVAEAQRRLKEGRLAAPFDGIVSQVVMEPGETAAPGIPVMEISGDGRWRSRSGSPRVSSRG